MNTTVKNGQSLFDIALQECGNAESAFNMAMLNGLSMTDVLSNGQSLELPDVTEKKIVQQYAVNEIFPATAITATQFNETISGEGVEFWGIEFDFIVS
ncbi:MAG: hypothetical protein J5588_06365 [Bacteroidales bacterium]|nr:hypothetical protein [Bacteroidales bacterium]MBP5372438.1 hypothetical protein [Bacteroidales bacterium]